MYIVVRDYRGEAQDVIPQVVQRQDSVKEAIRSIKGLVAYYLINTGNGGLASISVFEDQAGAEESIRVAANWVRENVAQWVPNPPSVIQGEVAFEAR
jgi:hypothetical protein